LFLFLLFRGRVCFRVFVFEVGTRNASGDVNFVCNFKAFAVGVVGKVSSCVAFDSGGNCGDEVSFKGGLTTDEVEEGFLFGGKLGESVFVDDGFDCAACGGRVAMLWCC